MSALAAAALFVFRLKTAGPASPPFVKGTAPGPEGAPEAAEAVEAAAAVQEEDAPETAGSEPEDPAGEDAEADDKKEETDHAGDNH